MTAADGVDLLRGARSVLLIDWPSREAPDTLARSGREVVSADGPEIYNAYELDGDEVRVRRLHGPPERVDFVYAFRPIEELPEIVEQARELRARAVWLERVAPDDLARARATVETTGLALVVGSILAAARDAEEGA